MSVFFMIFSIFSFVYCDAPKIGQYGLQDPATPAIEGMIFFHNYLLVFLILITVSVIYVLSYILKTFNSDVYEAKNIMKFSHSSLLEIVWTIIPAGILLLLAIPSFNLLYSLDELIDPSLTLKIVGHQWYWSYEYSDYAMLENSESLNFDSYMVNTEDLTIGSFRLLEVDNRVVLPVKTHIRLLVTAADVLHSWAVPSFGIKIDACPGRLSQISLFLKRVGVYYGQCSEICGVNHGFMPIVVKGVTASKFIKWLVLKLELLAD
jgi:cytochrome c oxidase subunit 2